MLGHDEYKFGVLYAKEGQEENEMFANGTFLLSNLILLQRLQSDHFIYIIVSTSKEFEQFLKILGERVTLKGWTRYAGGLDVKSTYAQSLAYLLGRKRSYIVYSNNTLL